MDGSIATWLRMIVVRIVRSKAERQSSARCKFEDHHNCTITAKYNGSLPNVMVIHKSDHRDQGPTVHSCAHLGKVCLNPMDRLGEMSGANFLISHLEDLSYEIYAGK